MATMSVQEREDASKMNTLVIAFDTLQVLGLVLLLALLAPALFSSNIKRTATWFGMIVSGIIYCASYLILMFIGGQGGSEPSTGVCLFQACLVHSTPIFGTSCALSFVMDVSESYGYCSSAEESPSCRCLSSVRSWGKPHLELLQLFFLHHRLSCS